MHGRGVFDPGPGQFWAELLNGRAGEPRSSVGSRSSPVGRRGFQVGRRSSLQQASDFAGATACGRGAFGGDGGVECDDRATGEWRGGRERRRSGASGRRWRGCCGWRGARGCFAGDGRLFARVPVENRSEVYGLKSGAFRDWLIGGHFRECGALPRDGAIRRVLGALEAFARFGGGAPSVFIRVGGDRKSDGSRVLH